ncbi:Os11g0644500, partial [Oryza sativa Japonica Group]
PLLQQLPGLHGLPLPQQPPRGRRRRQLRRRRRRLRGRPPVAAQPLLPPRRPDRRRPCLPPPRAALPQPGRGARRRRGRRRAGQPGLRRDGRVAEEDLAAVPRRRHAVRAAAALRLRRLLRRVGQQPPPQRRPRHLHGRQDVVGAGADGEDRRRGCRQPRPVGVPPPQPAVVRRRRPRHVRGLPRREPAGERPDNAGQLRGAALLHRGRRRRPAARHGEHRAAARVAGAGGVGVPVEGARRRGGGVARARGAVPDGVVGGRAAAGGVARAGPGDAQLLRQHDGVRPRRGGRGGDPGEAAGGGGGHGAGGHRVDRLRRVRAGARGLGGGAQGGEDDGGERARAGLADGEPDGVRVVPAGHRLRVRRGDAGHARVGEREGELRDAGRRSAAGRRRVVAGERLHMAAAGGGAGVRRPPHLQASHGGVPRLRLIHLLGTP